VISIYASAEVQAKYIIECLLRWEMEGSEEGFMFFMSFLKGYLRVQPIVLCNWWIYIISKYGMFVV